MIEIPNPASGPAAEKPQRGGAPDYEPGRAVERVAAVTASRYSPESLAEMKRLETFLKSGEPVRKDVPRGFYFNALV